MPEAADKHQIAPLRERLAAAGNLVQIGEQGGADLRCIRVQLRLLGRRHQDGHVGGRHDL